jgi:iron uptake system component EfeO
MFPARLPRLRQCLAIGIVGIKLGITAAPAIAMPLDDAAERYRPYLIEDIGRAVTGTQRLRDCLEHNDLSGAKAAWIAARAGWERSEVFTSGFLPDLDRDIDAWPDALKGFHAIEAKLFGANFTDVASLTDDLVGNLMDLGEQIRAIPMPPQRLLNGIARLAYEVGESKVDGGESRLSGTSIDDMRNNVGGIELAYRTIFAPQLMAASPDLADAIEAQIEQLKLIVEAKHLKNLDPDMLRTAGERLVVILQNAAPQIGLKKPALEETGE